MRAPKATGGDAELKVRKPLPGFRNLTFRSTVNAAACSLHSSSSQENTQKLLAGLERWVGLGVEEE